MSLTGRLGCHRRHAAVGTGFALALMTIGLGTAGAARDDTILVSRSGVDQAPANAGSGQSSISANGRFVAFESNATNLTNDGPLPDGPGPGIPAQVYVRDVQTGTVELVSRNDGPAGAIAQGSATGPSISGDGRFVAYVSNANNLQDSPGGGRVAVYVRDRQTGDTALVSRASGQFGAISTGTTAVRPFISQDGHYVAFDSDGDDLVPGDSNGLRDVFVRRISPPFTTELVSQGGGFGAVFGDGQSFAGMPSDTGRRIAFTSESTTFGPDANVARDVFIRDLDAGTTDLVSRADGPGGTPGDAASNIGAISGDGWKVSFQSDADNLSTEDDDAFANTFDRNVQTGATTLVSRASGPGGVAANNFSVPVAMSGDGEVVLFWSFADNLGAGDPATSDFFVRYLTSETTDLVSRAPGPAGAAGNGDSINYGDLTSDGRFAVFASAATNLVADATAGGIFRRQLLDDPGLSTPETGKTANLFRVSGTVKVREPGSNRFVTLTDPRQVRIGTVVDVTNGKVRLVSGSDAADGTRTAVFFDGRFRIEQRLPTTRNPYPFTELVLVGPLRHCGEAKASSSSIARAAAKGSGRRLWGNGSGRFRTQGKRLSVGVRGTRWLTWDRCDRSTLARVTQGSVKVRDFVRHRKVILRARGRDTYIARPRR